MKLIKGFYESSFNGIPKSLVYLTNCLFSHCLPVMSSHSLFIFDSRSKACRLYPPTLEDCRIAAYQALNDNVFDHILQLCSW